jgi:hypothetical protein
MNRKDESKFFVVLIIGVFVLINCFVVVRSWGMYFGWDVFAPTEVTLLERIMGTITIIIIVVCLIWGAWPTIKELCGKK